MVKKTNIAIIPARGGSKRIPRKNIFSFNGRPMLAWTVQAALESGCFDQVLVSTDDPEIAQEAITAGASVPFYRTQNADDQSPVSLATLSALRQAEQHWDTRFDQVVQLMPNCPLRTSDDIGSALKNFAESGSFFQISCFQFGWMNPWWAARLQVDGKPSPIFPEALLKRSQDLDRLFCPTGAIWVAERDSFLKYETFYGPDYRFFPLAWESAIDIDNLDDLQMALMIARLRQLKVGNSP